MTLFRLNRILIALVTLSLSGLLALTPVAQALVKIDKESVDLALKYGMQNKGLGLRNLLGGNWLEGPDGMLLNIYTPFMMLATKTYRGDYPENPSEEDLKKAKGKYARLITTLKDPNQRQEVKFSVAMYGDNPAFAANYRSRIQGFGRGKEFVLKPVRELRQKIANADPEVKVNPYEAINAYYFDFKDLAILEDYQFILENSDTGQVVTFRIRNGSIF